MTKELHVCHDIMTLARLEAEVVPFEDLEALLDQSKVLEVGHAVNQYIIQVYNDTFVIKLTESYFSQPREIWSIPSAKPATQICQVASVSPYLARCCSTHPACRKS
jgi:hypothetical protein